MMTGTSFTNSSFLGKAVRGIVPLFTNLERKVAVIWLNSNGWLISDQHPDATSCGPRRKCDDMDTRKTDVVLTPAAPQKLR